MTTTYLSMTMQQLTSSEQMMHSWLEKCHKETAKARDKLGSQSLKTWDNCKIVYDSATGKLLKVKIRMGPGYFNNGTPQDFYFPEGHEQAGVFKGMAIIIKKCRYMVYLGC